MHAVSFGNASELINNTNENLDAKGKNPELLNDIEIECVVIKF